MGKHNKITMQEIADRVGVSKYAVSRALSGKPGIGAVTREKIFEVASQLGYLNQRSAKKIAGNSALTEENKIVGILFPNIRSQNRESGYWGKVLDGIFRSLEAKGLGTILITDDSPQNFNLVMRPEGLLGIIGVGLIDTPMLMELRNNAIPFVLVDHEDELVESDTIFMNNPDIFRKLVKLLVGKGHSEIQFIGDWRYARSFLDRWNGFKSALDESGLPYRPEQGLLRIKPTTDADNMELLHHTLAKLQNGEFPTALVCANDKIASLVLRALSVLGIEVPEQCSVIGFDNEAEIVHEFPQLTTVNAEKEALGIKAVETLQWRLEHAVMPYEKIMLQSSPIIRGSLAGPAAH